MKGFKRHSAVYKILQVILTPYLKKKLNYSFEHASPCSKPYIVLSNHTTDYDCLLVGLSFPQMMYYVASEHIFRWGLISKIINYLVAPIPRIKAVKEVQTAKEIIRRLRAGANICIFAEGNRTTSGETCPIYESTGKLIKLCGVTLITYRLDGGYFTSPRWAKTLRRGKMTGKIVREYTPQEIKSMSVDEINEAIRNDLYVNAYQEQEKEIVAYNGKKLAENLETALYLCPECKGIATLSSNDDRFYCTCGLNLRYTPYGYLEGLGKSQPPFKTVLDWSKWQHQQVFEEAKKYLSKSGNEPIVSDKNQRLLQVEKTNSSQLLGEGVLSLYKDRMELICNNGNKYTFEFDRISDIANHGQMVLVFSTIDKISYEIKSRHPRSAFKYIDLFKALNLLKADVVKSEE